VSGAASDPGRLSSRVELQEEIETPDGAGGFTAQWTGIAQVWAEIRPVAGQSLERAGTGVLDVTHEITIRQRAGVRAGMRFAKGGRRFLIDALFDPDETGRWLKCQVREEG
jgi:SPP1 family predicted phage head-tail adaptor